MDVGFNIILMTHVFITLLILITQLFTDNKVCFFNYYIPFSPVGSFDVVNKYQLPKSNRSKLEYFRFN